MMKIIKKSHHILIIGAGAYGKALAHCVLTYSKNSVTLLNRQDCLVFQDDITNYDFILLTVPSQSLREVGLWVSSQLNKSKNKNKKLNIVSTAKGIEKQTILLPHQILAEVFHGCCVSIATLSGPSFAKELMKGLPTCVVLASKDEKMRKMISTTLHSTYFRIYDSKDILGVEIGGALKNVIAMIAGAVDGLGLGNNARAAVITRGLSEMAEIGVALGADPLTFMGLSGLGDLILTCTSELSRNRQFGYRVAKGEDHLVVQRDLGGVVEGMSTALSAYELTQKLKIKANILMTAYEVLYKKMPFDEAVKLLLSGQQSSEFDWTRINNDRDRHRK